jgi:hypothetical protein
VFNPSDPDTRTGGASVDRTGSVGFSSGVVTKGPIVRRPKTRTVALAEGAGNLFSVAKDSAGVTAWGSRELFIAGRDVTDTATLDQLAANALVERAASTQASTISIVDLDSFSPFIDFDPGDWVRGDLGTEIPRGNHRVVAVTGRIAGGLAEFDLDLGAQVFVGAAGTQEAVRRLIAKFDAPPEAGAGGSSSTTSVTNIVASAPIEPTFLIASSEATSAVRDKADYVCDGEDDQVEIQDALDAIGALGAPFGAVRLTGGTFYLTDGLVVPTGAALLGEGNQTWLDYDFSSWTEDGHGIELEADARIADLEIWAGTVGAGFSGGYDWIHTGVRGSVERIKFDDSGALTTMPFDYTVSVGDRSTVRDLQGGAVISVELAGAFCNIFGGSIDSLDVAGDGCNAVAVIVGTAITTTGGACNLVACELSTATLTIESSNLSVLGGYYENIETTATFGSTASLHSVRIAPSGHCYLTGAANVVSGCVLYELEVEDDAVVTGNVLLGDVTVNGAGNTEAQGGVVSGNQLTGHLLLDGACGVMVEGNHRLEAGSDYGIRLTTGADKNTVRNNVVRRDDGGTLTTGIDIATSDCNDNVIGSNAIVATTPVADSGTGTRQPDLTTITYAYTADPLTTITGAQPVVISEDADVVDVQAVVGTAPTGADIIVDVNVGGSSLWATQGAQPTITATTTDSGKTAPNQNASLDAGDLLTVDVDQVGSTVAGAKLTVLVRLRARF